MRRSSPHTARGGRAALTHTLEALSTAGRWGDAKARAAALNAKRSPGGGVPAPPRERGGGILPPPVPPPPPTAAAAAAGAWNDDDDERGGDPNLGDPAASAREGDFELRRAVPRRLRTLKRDARGGPHANLPLPLPPSGLAPSPESGGGGGGGGAPLAAVVPPYP